MPRPSLIAAALAAAALLPACGATEQRDDRVARVLAQPARTWAQLNDDDQRAALATCRLDRAVDEARGGDASSAPYYSSRFAAVMDLPGEDLHDRVTRALIDPANRAGSIAEVCDHAVVDLAAAPLAEVSPHADFASPVTVTRDALTLRADGQASDLQARVSPSDERLELAPAPGRTRTTARWRITERDGVWHIALRDIPRGTSYVEVRVGSWRRTLIVHQAPASRYPAPRTFQPITLHGQGEVGLPVLYVPQAAVVTPAAEGAPLTLTTGQTLLVAVGPSDRPTTIPLRPGRYRDVQVRTPGAWSIRIVPQSG